MEAPAAEKVHKIPVEGPARVVHIPTQDTRLRQNVAQQVQKAGHSFTTEQATPPASQPVPESNEMKEFGVERIGAEPTIDVADITDIMKKTAGHVVKSVGGEEGPLTHVETVPGSKVISFMRERGLLPRRRPRSQKAA